MPTPADNPEGDTPSVAAVAQRRTTLLVCAILAVGVLFAISLWTAAFVLIDSEQSTALTHARTEVGNLSAVFQEEVTRELNDVASAMELVASRMRSAQGAFDIHEWVSEIPLLSAPTIQAAIIGPDGHLLSTTLDPYPKPIDMSDREHFRVHLDPTHHGLFISKPVVGRISGQVTIQITKRVDSADGRFLGVIVFSVAPSHLTALHDAINLGPGGMLTLFGTDNIVRARFGTDSPDGTNGIGAALTPMAARIATGEKNDLIHVGASTIDHVVRIYSDRRLIGYPLYVGVGLDLGEILAPARAHARQIEAIATVVTLLLFGLLAALIIEIRRRGRNEAQLSQERSALAADVALREQVEQRLRDNEQKFQDIAEVSGDWIWESDAEHRFTYLPADTFAERTGWSVTGPLGKTRWELAGVDPTQDRKWRLHKADLDVHRPFRSFRYAVNNDKGEVRHFVVSGKPVFAADGAFLGYRGTASDETRMVEALERVEQAETLLRDAMDSMSEGFVIYDSDDRLVMCNKAYRRMHPVTGRFMVPGVKLEEVARLSLASGYYPDAVGREEEWLAEFMRHHHEAVGEVETQLQDGRWIRVSSRRMNSGGIAGLRVDITELKRIQRALHASEERLRDFAEMASDWFWEQNADLCFVWFSDGLRVINAMPQPYIGMQRWAMNPDGATPEQWEFHKADLAARRPFRDFRYCMRGDDGSLRHVSIHGDPLFDSAGRFTGYRGIGRDITAQIEAEQELERAKERAEQAETLLRDAVDSMSEGFVIFDCDDRFVMCNDVYCQVYADGADFMAPGVRFDELVRHVLAKGGNLDARGREDEWLAERVRQHREATGSMEHQRANGRWYLATDRRMKSGGTAGLRIDITALKQAQAALSESEARLDRAQEIAGIGSWELDVATGRYVWSKELYRMRGVSPDAFEPDIENVAAYVHHDDYPVVRRWLAHLMAGQEQGPLEPRIVRPDGSVRVLRVEGRAATDPDGTVHRVAGTMQDITERRQIERQFAQAQKMEAIGSLTGGMAHDFNNVLGVVIGNLDLLRRLVNEDAAALELCGEALDGATRCADLIRRLLAYARRQSLHPELTGVNALVGDVARMLERLLGEDITLDLVLDPDLRPIMADTAQLESALVNFATNARDAMPHGGQLHITTRNAVLDPSYTAQHPDVSPGDYVLIEISDTGTGISPEVIGRIFEPFFTTKGPGKGTGLGLSMAFGFVKQSGGHLAVYSEPGLGTTFRIYLPQCDTGDVTQARIADTSTLVGGDETVLVVEDNAQLRHATMRQLTELGYQVLEAEHADAALAILADECQVDLLFSDVVMPGAMDGLDLAHRALTLRPNLKVLLTSGFPGVRGADHWMADCPFPLLNKPYRRDELARLLREALASDRDPPAYPTTWRAVMGAQV